MAETSSRLTAVARRLTAERGLHGFTVEQLCEEVGVSRRTFFNYFHSKDDAIIGLSDGDLDPEAVERFLDGGTGAGVSPALLDDLVQLAVDHIRMITVSPEQAAAFLAAVEREPHLLQRLMRTGDARERALVELVETREGLTRGDRRAELAVLLVGAMMRSSGERFVAPGNSVPLDELLLDALAASKAVFAAALLSPAAA
jgi:AcrR family transcriptional regulator